MRTFLDRYLIILRIAFRNLFASRVKTLVVSAIVLFGAFLVVLGTSILDSVDDAMKRSLVGSVAGHLQVYAAASEEELDVMGGFDIDGAELEPLPHFERIKQVLMDVPNVERVVPMGISGAFVTSGNTIDMVLASLRETVKQRRARDAAGQPPDAQLQASYAAQKDHVRRIVRVLRGDLGNLNQLLDASAQSDKAERALTRAGSDRFWQGFDADPLMALEYLENNVAPIATDADILALRYLGTDPQAFSDAFDRFEIVDGQMIPPGERGFLFAKFQYERQVKLKTARNLDRIKQLRDERGASIAQDDELKRLVRENRAQVRELLLQLDAQKSQAIRTQLQALLASEESALDALLADFFDTTDANFEARYRFFYDELAPHLSLYRVPVGSTLTIKAFTRGGYVRSINVPVYGTFTFKGLENSPQVGALNLMDLASFRDLYGFMTDARQEEISALQAQVDVQDVTRENAEAALFGAPAADGDDPSGAPSPDDQVDDPARAVRAGDTAALDASLAALRGRRAEAELPRRFDPASLQRGTFLNAAVLLTDPDALSTTKTAIEAAVRAHDLGLKVVDWQEASGLTGQFVTLMRLILAAAVLIIFAVAIVVISNALLMATLERLQEIGTLRALGAQRRFVLAMLMTEGVLLGLVFGALGALLGAAAIGLLGFTGIPAWNDVMTFFFSGSRLYPTLAGGHVVLSLLIVISVSVISCIYPAWIALRVSPRQAMQSEE